VILGMVRPQGAPSDAAPSVPVIGVPGFPVSAALTGEIFVRPLLARWLGHSPEAAPVIEAIITRKVLSPLGDDEYLRVTVGQVGERVWPNRARPGPARPRGCLRPTWAARAGWWR
jgi:putative molybdopterin biosynthesis protein